MDACIERDRSYLHNTQIYKRMCLGLTNFNHLKIICKESPLASMPHLSGFCEREKKNNNYFIESQLAKLSKGVLFTSDVKKTAKR